MTEWVEEGERSPDRTARAETGGRASPGAKRLPPRPWAGRCQILFGPYTLFRRIGECSCGRPVPAHPPGAAAPPGPSTRFPAALRSQAARRRAAATAMRLSRASTYALHALAFLA